MIAKVGEIYKIGQKRYKAVKTMRPNSCRDCQLTDKQCISSRSPDCTVNNVIFKLVVKEVSDE